MGDGPFVRGTGSFTVMGEASDMDEPWSGFNLHGNTILMIIIMKYY